MMIYLDTADTVQCSLKKTAIVTQDSIAIQTKKKLNLKPKTPEFKMKK